MKVSAFNWSWFFILRNRIPGTHLFYALFCGLLLTFNGFAQQPLNLNFETGTFSGWIGATGQCCPVYTPAVGIDTSRHVITSGNYTDPHSAGIVQVVAPGSLFSARLGNDSGSAESEILNYTFTVPSDSLILVVRFAVILENAHHPAVKQPRFKYEISSSASLPGNCLSEQITAGDSSYDFILNGSYEILDWQNRYINLTGLSGQTITLHFETGDCEPGGHFGYAYVDGNLVPGAINGTICNPGGSITLFAPQGIDGTWFDGSTSDSIVISNPLAGAAYTFQAGDEFGCGVTLSKIIDDEFPQSNFSITTNCNQEVQFTNLSVAAINSVYNWQFGDNTFSPLHDPVHVYNGYGTYEVSLTVHQPNNCIAVHHENFTLQPGPEAAFDIPENCAGSDVLFQNNSQYYTGSTLIYEWYIDGNLFYSIPSPVHQFETEGIYTISLIVTDDANCRDTTNSLLNVLPAESCPGADEFIWFPNAFTPNGDGVNDSFGAVPFDNNNIIVFNRFGEQVFSGQSWNGTFNGSNCPAGIYSFRLSTQNAENSLSPVRTVMLVR